MTACQRFEDRLEAFHDGELAGFERWRVSRHVAACARCRGDLETLREIAGLVRDEEGAAGPGPDLWASIAARLPAIDAELGLRAVPDVAPLPVRERRGWAALLGPLPIGMGGLAAAAIALVLYLRVPVAVPLDDVVEELDTMGRPVAVLPSDDKSTIIWVLDPKPVASAKEAGGAVL